MPGTNPFFIKLLKLLSHTFKFVDIFNLKCGHRKMKEYDAAVVYTYFVWKMHAGMQIIYFLLVNVDHALAIIDYFTSQSPS